MKNRQKKTITIANRRAISNIFTKQLPKLFEEKQEFFINCSATEIKQRLDTCLACDESFFTDTGKLRCANCGCYLKEKTMLKTQKCGLGLW